MGRPGPLSGFRLVEFEAIGPAPMCGMLLADLGAKVLRIERVEKVELGSERPLRYEVLLRGRERLALDLKTAAGKAAALEIVSRADAVIEGLRPGAMERLGLGPRDCQARNPRLVYGRMTGWGQDGPLAQAAGHDINYIALSGALHATGRAGAPPAVPLNIVGDFGGGALYLALGVVSALLHAQRTGEGQVVDASVLEGTLSLMAMHFGSAAAGLWNMERGSNLIDSGAPFYDVYECADGQWISVGAIESRFFDQLLARLEVPRADFADRRDRTCWPRLRATLAERFRSRRREEWCRLLEGTDCCFAPVLSMQESALHPHVVARRALVENAGVIQPNVAPRFSATPGAVGAPPRPVSRSEAQESLRAWFGAGRLEQPEACGLLDAVQGTAGEAAVRT
jgi:crotonobetainyl-CoA:carnitine CoA-transferase CaiB-like acyl-CoA transferase